MLHNSPIVRGRGRGIESNVKNGARIMSFFKRLVYTGCPNCSWDRIFASDLDMNEDGENNFLDVKKKYLIDEITRH